MSSMYAATVVIDGERFELYKGESREAAQNAAMYAGGTWYHMGSWGWETGWKVGGDANEVTVKAAEAAALCINSGGDSANTHGGAGK